MAIKSSRLALKITVSVKSFRDPAFCKNVKNFGLGRCLGAAMH